MAVDKRDRLVKKFIKAHDPNWRDVGRRATARRAARAEVGSAYRNRIPSPGLPPSDWQVKR